MNTNTTEQVMQILREVYDELDGTGDIEINPALIAARTLKRIDPDSESPVLVGWMAVLEMRQMARSLCRRVSCIAESASVQSELFDGQLQRRYPALRGGEEIYVLRECMTIAERRIMAARLYAEGESKIKHAQALDAETDKLEQAGAFELDNEIAQTLRIAVAPREHAKALRAYGASRFAT